MSKFIADSCHRMTNEAGDLILCFAVKSDKRSAKMACEEAKAINGRIEIDLRQHKSKRSLEQNKMLWALLGKLAEAQSGRRRWHSVEECYCDMLVEANASYDYILALPTVEPSLRKMFRAIRIMGERDVNGKTLTVYQVFCGSSKFNTKEMTMLIEAVLDKLAEFGIYDSEIELARAEYRKDK